ncbi:MAG: class I SAM-dependent methyltransferase [Fervidobacterium sp.]
MWAVQNGAYVTSVEPAQHMLEISKLKNHISKCEFICSKAEEIATHLNQKYDIIFLFGDVLSYVDEPTKVLSNLKDLSKRGTLIFGTFDNFYAYLRDVIIYDTKADYEYFKKFRKLPVGSEHVFF